MPIKKSKKLVVPGSGMAKKAATAAKSRNKKQKSKLDSIMRSVKKSRR